VGISHLYRGLCVIKAGSANGPKFEPSSISTYTTSSAFGWVDEGLKINNSSIIYIMVKFEKLFD